MAGWGQVGSLKGPKGDPGNPGLDGDDGVGVASAAVNGAGELVITLTNAQAVNVGLVKGADGADGAPGADGLDGAPGERGADGTSVTIKGNVANVAALPAGLGPEDAGDGYITQNDGHLHVWSGTAFTDVGSVRGPQGPPGVDGTNGTDGTDGADGQDGRGVVSATVDGAGRLIVTLTDTSTIDAGVVRGQDGATGQRGTRWFHGDGAPGAIEGSLAGDLYLDRVTGTYYELT